MTSDLKGAADHSSFLAPEIGDHVAVALRTRDDLLAAFARLVSCAIAQPSGERGHRADHGHGGVHFHWQRPPLRRCVARGVEALYRPADVVTSISTWGHSKDVLRGLQAARARDGVAIACTEDAPVEFQLPV